MTEPSPVADDIARRRRFVVGMLGFVVVAGLVIPGKMGGGSASDIVGDVLYAVAAYLAVVLIAPRMRPIAVAGISLAWCWLIEVFQLTGLPLQWGAALPLITIGLGTVFDLRDLVVYTAAVMGAASVDALSALVRRHPARV